MGLNRLLRPYLKLDAEQCVECRTFPFYVRPVLRAALAYALARFARAQDVTAALDLTVSGRRIRFYRFPGPQHVVHLVSVFGCRSGNVHGALLVGKGRGQQQRKQPRERTAHLARTTDDYTRSSENKRWQIIRRCNNVLPRASVECRSVVTCAMRLATVWCACWLFARSLCGLRTAPRKETVWRAYWSDTRRRNDNHTKSDALVL